MNLDQIIKELDLTLLTEPKDFSAVEVNSGYCSDLLSCVMTGAEPGGVWITLMAHGNIVAVAALLDLAAIIITEDAQPEQDTLAKANEKGVTILSCPKPNYFAVGKLWDMGLPAAEK